VRSSYLTRALASQTRRPAGARQSRIAPVIPPLLLRDDLKIDWDVPVEMDDGLLVLRRRRIPTAAEARHRDPLRRPTARGSRSRRGYRTRPGKSWRGDYQGRGRGPARTGYANWEVGRSGKWRAGRLRMRCASLRGAGRTLTGLLCHLTRARDARTSTVQRVGAAAQAWSSGKKSA